MLRGAEFGMTRPMADYAILPAMGPAPLSRRLRLPSVWVVGLRGPGRTLTSMPVTVLRASVTLTNGNKVLERTAAMRS